MLWDEKFRNPKLRKCLKNLEKFGKLKKIRICQNLEKLKFRKVENLENI